MTISCSLTMEVHVTPSTVDHVIESICVSGSRHSYLAQNNYPLLPWSRSCVLLSKVLAPNEGPPRKIHFQKNHMGQSQVLAWTLCAQPSMLPPQVDVGESFLGPGPPFVLVDSLMAHSLGILLLLGGNCQSMCLFPNIWLSSPATLPAVLVSPCFCNWAPFSLGIL